MRNRQTDAYSLHPYRTSYHKARNGPGPRFRLVIASLAALALVGGACGEDTAPAGDAGLADDATNDGGGAGADADVTAPLIDAVRLVESPACVLAYLLEVETSEATRLRVDVQPPTGSRWTLQGSRETTEHAIPIAGLRASTRYAISIEVTDAAGNSTTDSSRDIETDGLPQDLPPVEVLTSKPNRMAPGSTLFNVLRWEADSSAPDLTKGWLLILDAAGEVVWYAITSNQPTDARIMPNGNLGYIFNDEQLAEIDVLGREKRRWAATALMSEPPEGAIVVDTDSFHHAFQWLPNGNLLTLSSELRAIDTATCPNYAPPEGDSLNVVGDVIVEFDPKSGAIVAQHSLFDSLDPCRRTDRDFASSFWNARYGGKTTQDWTHGNALVYDADRQLILLSLRHSDWIVAYDYTPGSGVGDIAWILGDEGEPGDYRGAAAFAPEGTTFAWPYHQHAPMWTSAGHLLLYDNGNLRPGTNFDPDDVQGNGDLPYSRAVAYALDMSADDPTDWTIREVWQWRDALPEGGSRYAPFVGDADELANGNVLVTVGGLLTPPTDRLGDPENKKWARIVEVARGDSDDVVFEVQLRDPSEEDFVGYTVYRAERIEGFLR